jgi:hypothetical protein
MSNTLETAASEINPTALDTAVAANHAAPAPSDPFAAFMARVEGFMTEAHARLTQVEEVAAAVAPLIEAGAAVASPAAGGAVSSVVSRLGALESFASDLFDAFDAHFQGKIALPPPPAGG